MMGSRLRRRYAVTLRGGGMSQSGKTAQGTDGPRVDTTDADHDESFAMSRDSQVADALRESEANYQAVVDNVTDGIAINVDSKRVFVNRAFLRIHGLSDISEALGSEVDRYIVDGDKQKVVERVLARQRGEQVSPINEFRIRLPDGAIRWLESSSTRIHHRGLPASLSILRDITERKETEVMLARQAEELTRSNRDLEEFAYVASHDLREPLRMISSFAQLLASRYQGTLDEDGEEFLAYVVEGAHKMSALINDLLTFSRIGTKTGEMKPTDSLGSLLEALKNLELATHDAGAVVTHEELPMVEADERQLTQLFQNLVANAIKFHGDSSPAVHITAVRVHGGWQFSVKDNGIGIDPAYAERIFAVFQRLHTDEEYAGSGIGLAICKKIVERHHGRIWVESELDQGTTVHFTMPDPAEDTI